MIVSSLKTVSAGPERPRAKGFLRLRNLSLLFGVLIVLFFVVLGRDTSGSFAARRGELADVEIESREIVAEHVVERVRLTSTSGLVVELALKYPEAEEGGRPLLMMFGGVDNGRDGVDLIASTRGTVIAVVNYPYYNDKKLKGLAVVPAIAGIRRGIRDTMPAAQLALDWLLERDDVAPEKVELVGVSAGAPFVCIIGGLDQRFRRVWSVQGAADVPTLMSHNLRHRISFAPARWLTGHLASFLAVGYSFAPEDWVGRIAPRPFLMVNSLDDERLPRSCVERLFDAASEPKEIDWIQGQHVHPKRTDVVRALVGRVLDRVESDPLGE